ncbi:MAG: hypothetical protein RBS99_05550, partial [Rhodospirillales bacterium]|nr:hypothetical protein [Rhodospirillales bacterium]
FFYGVIIHGKGPADQEKRDNHKNLMVNFAAWKGCEMSFPQGVESTPWLRNKISNTVEAILESRN